MIEYFERQLKELDDSIHSLDENVFQRFVNEAVAVIESGHKIIASGLGKNVPICEKFVGSMVSLGMNACFLHTNSALHGDAGMVNEGDMVILLTKSGETKESIELANLIANRDIDLWLLTFSEDSTLSNSIKNKLILKLNHEGDLWNIMPNNSTMVNLFILQGLVMQIAKIRNLQITDFKRNHPGGHIGEILKRKNYK